MEINTYLARPIKLIKGDRKSLYNEHSIHQRILKKSMNVYKQILSSTAVFNVDNNKKCCLNLKDHMTLKTGVMMLKINKNKLHFEIY